MSYARAPGKPLCQHGANCYRNNPLHFLEFDHPADHPKMPRDDAVDPPAKRQLRGSDRAAV